MFRFPRREMFRFPRRASPDGDPTHLSREFAGADVAVALGRVRARHPRIVVDVVHRRRVKRRVLGDARAVVPDVPVVPVVPDDTVVPVVPVVVRIVVASRAKLFLRARARALSRSESAPRRGHLFARGRGPEVLPSRRVDEIPGDAASVDVVFVRRAGRRFGRGDAGEIFEPGSDGVRARRHLAPRAFADARAVYFLHHLAVHLRASSAMVLFPRLQRESKSRLAIVLLAEALKPRFPRLVEVRKHRPASTAAVPVAAFDPVRVQIRADGTRRTNGGELDDAVSEPIESRVVRTHLRRASSFVRRLDVSDDTRHRNAAVSRRASRRQNLASFLFLDVLDVFSVRALHAEIQRLFGGSARRASRLVLESHALAPHAPLQPLVLHAHRAKFRLPNLPRLLRRGLFPPPRLNLLEFAFQNLETTTLLRQRALLAFATLSAPTKLVVLRAKLRGGHADETRTRLRTEIEVVARRFAKTTRGRSVLVRRRRRVLLRLVHGTERRLALAVYFSIETEIVRVRVRRRSTRRRHPFDVAFVDGFDRVVEKYAARDGGAVNLRAALGGVRGETKHARGVAVQPIVVLAVVVAVVLAVVLVSVVVLVHLPPYSGIIIRLGSFQAEPLETTRDARLVSSTGSALARTTGLGGRARLPRGIHRGYGRGDDIDVVRRGATREVFVVVARQNAALRRKRLRDAKRGSDLNRRVRRTRVLLGALRNRRVRRYLEARVRRRRFGFERLLVVVLAEVVRLGERFEVRGRRARRREGDRTRRRFRFLRQFGFRRVVVVDGVFLGVLGLGDASRGARVRGDGATDPAAMRRLNLCRRRLLRHLRRRRRLRHLRRRRRLHRLRRRRRLHRRRRAIDESLHRRVHRRLVLRRGIASLALGGIVRVFGVAAERFTRGSPSLRRLYLDRRVRCSDFFLFLGGFDGGVQRGVARERVDDAGQSLRDRRVHILALVRFVVPLLHLVSVSVVIPLAVFGRRGGLRGGFRGFRLGVARERVDDAGQSLRDRRVHILALVRFVVPLLHLVSVSVVIPLAVFGRRGGLRGGFRGFRLGVARERVDDAGQSLRDRRVHILALVRFVGVVCPHVRGLGLRRCVGDDDVRGRVVRRCGRRVDGLVRGCGLGRGRGPGILRGWLGLRIARRLGRRLRPRVVPVLRGCALERVVEISARVRVSLPRVGRRGGFRKALQRIRERQLLRRHRRERAVNVRTHASRPPRRRQCPQPRHPFRISHRADQDSPPSSPARAGDEVLDDRGNFFRLSFALTPRRAPRAPA